jgi:hypothetical protein
MEELGDVEPLTSHGLWVLAGDSQRPLGEELGRQSRTTFHSCFGVEDVVGHELRKFDKIDASHVCFQARDETTKHRQFTNMRFGVTGEYSGTVWNSTQFLTTASPVIVSFVFAIYRYHSSLYESWKDIVSYQSNWVTDSPAACDPPDPSNR